MQAGVGKMQGGYSVVQGMSEAYLRISCGKLTEGRERIYSCGPQLLRAKECA